MTEIAEKNKRKEYDAELQQIAVDIQEMQEEFDLAMYDPVTIKLAEGISRQTEIMKSRIAYDDFIKYKLDRVFFLLDVENEEVEKVMDTYDISPGESYLEWCHTYPPILHTYEELPLIKEYIEKDQDESEEDAHHKKTPKKAPKKEAKAHH